MDLIFGAVVSFALAAEFQSRKYASGGRQVDCVVVLCGVIFILLGLFVALWREIHLTIYQCFDKIKL